MTISWYNNYDERGDYKKQDIKKEDRSSWQLNDHPKKAIYIY